MWKSTSASGAPDNSWRRPKCKKMWNSTRRGATMMPALARSSGEDSARRHAIEQASRRWRGGRRDDSARTRRKILISTQEQTIEEQVCEMCPTMTFKQRLIALICCCVLGYILEICGTLTLIGGPTARNIRAGARCCALALQRQPYRMATAFWVGPKLMCKKMWNSGFTQTGGPREARRPCTSCRSCSSSYHALPAVFDCTLAVRRAPHARRGALLRGLVLRVLRAEGAVVRREGQEQPPIGLRETSRRSCVGIQCRRKHARRIIWFCRVDTREVDLSDHSASSGRSAAAPLASSAERPVPAVSSSRLRTGFAPVQAVHVVPTEACPQMTRIADVAESVTPRAAHEGKAVRRRGRCRLRLSTRSSTIYDKVPTKTHASPRRAFVFPVCFLPAALASRRAAPPALRGRRRTDYRVDTTCSKRTRAP